MAPQKQTIETVAVALMLLPFRENGYNKDPTEPRIHPKICSEQMVVAAMMVSYNRN